MKYIVGAFLSAAANPGPPYKSLDFWRFQTSIVNATTQLNPPMTGMCLRAAILFLLVVLSPPPFCVLQLVLRRAYGVPTSSSTGSCPPSD
ncbi:hypothetical protein V5799_033636 [Amblyomma americanum]|uniref:Uncharacterized protein n=1 Tax=Amblyomma americanum TaxID=6943 RepID=A0AAQ4DMR5_AMBAM